MPIKHLQLVAAAQSTLTVPVPGISTADQCGWLNETELSSRLKSDVVQVTKSFSWKMEGSGRSGQYGHKADITEFQGTQRGQRVEVVYFWSKSKVRSGMPPKTLEEDLERIVVGEADHVVAFIPPCESGYSVGGKSFSVAGNSIAPPSGAMFLMHCIKLNSAAKIVVDSMQQIATCIAIPTVGTKPRWSLAASIPTKTIKIKLKNASVDRTIFGSHIRGFWGVVWSRCKTDV